MDSIIDSFFDSFSNGIDQNRLESRQNLERSYEASLRLAEILDKKYRPPGKFQNPFVHSRISFPGTSSVESFLDDLFNSTDLKSESNFIHDDYGFFISTTDFGGSYNSNLIIEGRSGRDGAIDLLLYFSKRSQVLYSFPYKSSPDSFDVVFQHDGKIRRMDFSRISEKSFSSDNFVIITNEGLIDRSSDIDSDGNN